MPVPDFSPGEVLTAAAMDSIGLWLVKSQTIGTGVSSVVVNDAFSADYDQYLITVSGGASSTATNLALRFGAKTTNYRGVLLYAGYNNTPLASGASNNTSFVFGASGTTSGLQACISVVNPFLAKNTSISNFYTSSTETGSHSGDTNDTTSYTSFTFVVGAGTITGGNIRVYGYRN